MKKYLLAAFAILLVLVQVTACSKKKDDDKAADPTEIAAEVPAE